MSGGVGPVRGSVREQEIAPKGVNTEFNEVRLPAQPSGIEVPRESTLGERLTQINNTLHSNQFFYSAVIRNADGDHHLKIEAVDRHGPFKIYGGPSIEVADLNNAPLSIPVNELLFQDKLGFTAGRGDVALNLDRNFRAEFPLKALEAESREDRFIVERDDPEYPKMPQCIRSTKFIGARVVEGEQRLCFELDSGSKFELDPQCIRAIYRAGKEHTLIEGGCYEVESSRGGITQVNDFESAPIGDYFCRFQKITVGYRSGDGPSRDEITGVFLEASDVATYQGAYPTGTHKRFLFVLVDGETPRVFGIELDRVAFIAGHAGESSQVEGNSRSATPLGKLSSYRQGNPIYQRPE